MAHLKRDGKRCEGRYVQGTNMKLFCPTCREPYQAPQQTTTKGIQASPEGVNALLRRRANPNAAAEEKASPYKEAIVANMSGVAEQVERAKAIQVPGTPIPMPGLRKQEASEPTQETVATAPPDSLSPQDAVAAAIAAANANRAKAGEAASPTPLAPQPPNEPIPVKPPVQVSSEPPGPIQQSGTFAAMQRAVVPEQQAKQERHRR